MTRLLTVQLAVETDFILARQRAKQIAEALGFGLQDQTRIATAVSEIARNAYEYANGGLVEFLMEAGSEPAMRIVVRDSGGGIASLPQILDGTYVSAAGMGLGISGSRRLVDDLDIQSSPAGTTVTLCKRLPSGVPAPSLDAVSRAIGSMGGHDLGAAAQAQNREIARLLTDLRERESELAQLNLELKETNRGVMVLYSELEDRALELQQASEMKTRFISGVTHELRTPLNSIVSLAGLLIRRIDGDLTPEQEKQVQFIQRSAQNLTEMVNDLLDLAKIEAGKLTARLSEFTIAELFSALRGLFRPLVLSDRVQLLIQDGGEDSSVVNTRLYTDEGKLAQILRNYIANALKFTENGSVQVHAERFGDRGVRFAVRDTGIGIAPENQEIVWQEWGQIESDQRARPKGSGLGLPLSRQLATLLGGTTRLESALGQGSTFYLDLPNAVAPAEAVSTAAGTATEHTILMVDDDEVARYILRRNLVRLTSARIVEADSPAQARHLLAEHMPSVVFLDIVMPDENGLTFAEELRSTPSTASLPIVLVSSKVLTPAEQAIVDRHGIPYINKDQGDAEDKRAAVERALLNLGLSDLHHGAADGEGTQP